MTVQDRRALEAGLPPDLLLVLIRGRRWWQATGQVERTPELATAVGHPAAAGWDDLFMGAARRRA